MKESHWKRWREFWRGRDLDAARAVEREAISLAERNALHPDFVAALVSLSHNPAEAVRLGRLGEGPLRNEDFLVALESLLAHLLALGASGSGKTYFLLLLVLVLLESGRLNSFLLLDMKGEFAELMTELALPALAATRSPIDADAFLDRIVVVDPFHGQFLPPLNVLVRDPGLPVAIQAQDVAECFEAATGSDVTSRMETILDWVLRLVIATRGSFHTVRRALQEPAVLEGLVRQVNDPELVRYFLTRYPSEPKASKLALLSRLDRFLALPMTSLCLGANVTLDFDRLLKDRITIVSLGNAPAGLSSVARFFAMVIFTRLVRAIFRLPARSKGFHALVVVDEWQVALTSALAAEFESILTLARSRGVHLWLANQQLTQLDRFGSVLRSVVLGQTALQVTFRLSPDDARALKGGFPVTGTVRRTHGTGSPFLTPHEELDHRVAHASRLPDRTGYWLDRRVKWGAVPFHSATLDLPAPKSLPPDIVRRAKEGSVRLTHQDLTAMRDAEDARLDQLAAGPTPATRALGAPSRGASPMQSPRATTQPRGLPSPRVAPSTAAPSPPPPRRRAPRRPPPIR